MHLWVYSSYLQYFVANRASWWCVETDCMNNVIKLLATHGSQAWILLPGADRVFNRCLNSFNLDNGQQTIETHHLYSINFIDDTCYFQQIIHRSLHTQYIYIYCFSRYHNIYIYKSFHIQLTKVPFFRPCNVQSTGLPRSSQVPSASAEAFWTPSIPRSSAAAPPMFNSRRRRRVRWWAPS